MNTQNGRLPGVMGIIILVFALLMFLFFATPVFGFNNGFQETKYQEATKEPPTPTPVISSPLTQIAVEYEVSVNFFL